MPIWLYLRSMIREYKQLPHTRQTALAATVAVHLGILWYLAQQTPRRHEGPPRQAIQWLWLPKPSPAPAVAPPPEKARTSTASVPAIPVQPPAQPVTIAPPEQAPAAPSANVETMLQQAKAAVAGIDKDLRKETRGLIRAPADSPQIRMRKGIEQAAELVPNKWYEAPKIIEIIDAGGYDRKRYKVVTPSGTYCVTYESNHAPDGLDIMKNGIKPKLTSCPQHEGPATRQEW